jgi:hypothetical protein
MNTNKRLDAQGAAEAWRGRSELPMQEAYNIVTLDERRPVPSHMRFRR